MKERSLECRSVVYNYFSLSKKKCDRNDRKRVGNILTVVTFRLEGSAFVDDVRSDAVMNAAG